MKRYRELSETVTVSDLKLLSGLPFLDFLYSGGVIYSRVESNEDRRIDLIAYRYLGDFRLWPLIAWFNGIRDPLTEVTSDPQTVLAIPVDPITLVRNLRAFTYRNQ